MVRQHPEESSRLSTALTGISLAVSIAREATDAVPIVKQALGAAVRIVALVEKMDRDREALHALAEQSLQLARRVKDVMVGRTPDANLASSLERILRALDSIETFMTKHASRSRVRRAIGYAFTVPQHLEHLSRDLSNAVQELIIVAQLEVEHEARATHAAVEHNARFAGEFRLLRHCEVQKLERIFKQEDGEEDENEIFRYHCASVDGQLYVVRYFEGSSPQDSRAVQSQKQWVYDRIASHDHILEELSTVHRSHRNLARIYGRSWDSGCDRFTVFKTGFLMVEGLLDEFPDPVTPLFLWAVKLLDAAHHLRQMGISWRPNKRDCFALDDRLEPTIGLQDDLRRLEPGTDPLFETYNQLFYSLQLVRHRSQWQRVASADLQAAVSVCGDERLINLLGILGKFHRQRHLIVKADFFKQQILREDTAETLFELAQNDHAMLDGRWHVPSWAWAQILLALDGTRRHWPQKGLQVMYTARTHGSDCLEVDGMDEVLVHVVCDQYFVDIPDSQRDEVRAMLSITPPSEEQEETRGTIIATGGPGTYCAPD